MPSSWGIFVLRLVTFTETKKASLENPSGPKRCWSNESTNLICWAPVLSLRIRELQCLRYLDSDAIGSLLHAWLSRITFMVVQLITFMVKLYNICGQWIYCICEWTLLHLWSVLHLWLVLHIWFILHLSVTQQLLYTHTLNTMNTACTKQTIGTKISYMYFTSNLSGKISSERTFVHKNLLFTLAVGHLVYLFDLKLFTTKSEHVVSTLYMEFIANKLV